MKIQENRYSYRKHFSLVRSTHLEDSCYDLEELEILLPSFAPSYRQGFAELQEGSIHCGDDPLQWAHFLAEERETSLRRWAVKGLPVIFLLQEAPASSRGLSCPDSP